MNASQCTVGLTIHAMLRYADRVMGIDVAGVAERIGRPGFPSNEAQVLWHLKATGEIDVRVLRRRMITPAVELAAKMATQGCTVAVITSEGRIVIRDNKVISFLDRSMKHPCTRDRFDENDARQADRRRRRAA